MKQTVFQAFKPYARVFILVLSSWASFGMAADVSAKSHGVKHRPVIRVRIYNYAHVHRLDLRDAERHAAYLFAKAGIRIAWTVRSQKQRAGRPQTEDSNSNFFVRIVPASMAVTFFHKPRVLGQSLVSSGVQGPTPGGIANVSYERVKKLSSESGSFFGEVLGDAMAHELGHLLLGSGHSSGGIMRARWTLRDLKPDNRTALQFTSAQVVLLQRAVQLLKQDYAMMAARR